MNIITYLKDVNPVKFCLAIFFLVFGFYNFLFWSIYSGIFQLALSIYLFVRQGSEIDLDNKTYRTIHYFFGIKQGQWKPIPKFEYVSVFRTNEIQQVNATSASARLKNQVILLNLFYEGNKHVTFYKTNSIEDAFKVARHFELALDVDILDATEREKKWL